MRIAMIGTRGVPARYGGFETAIEEVGSRLAHRGHEVIVYCRNPSQTITEHKGMRLVNLPAMHKKSLETLSHTGLSVAHALKLRPDAAIVFNAANAPYLRFLKARGIPTAVHMDGLEWKRAKWTGAGARYYKHAEAVAARAGLALIADAQGIADYLQTTYHRSSYLIAYGAPILEPDNNKLADLELTPREYHLVVARMEPENHILEIVSGYTQSGSSVPLVVVGSAPYGDTYIDQVQQSTAGVDVRYTGAIWDQDLLNQLYAHCRSYLHGHSVGGTNPSLLRALGCGAPVTAFDVNFNREVTAGHALFFGSPEDVTAAIRQDDDSPTEAALRGKRGREHAAATYQWDDVADKYEQMLLEISAGARRR